MSYTSAHKLPKGTSLRRLREVVELLGYERVRLEIGKVPGSVGHYFWFEAKDYQSTTGVALDIYEKHGRLTIDTQTPAARSHWDLEHQNRTLKLLRETFGGDFRTDAGKNRCFRSLADPPAPPESGCNRAFYALGRNLMRADVYLMARSFPHQWKSMPIGLWILDSMNPRILSNHFVVVFLLATIDDFLKSTFVALLRYSPSRGDILKSVRLSSGQATAVSVGSMALEEAFVEGLTFSRPSVAFKNFNNLDPKLKIDSAVRKPVGRRKLRLDDEIEGLVELRNQFVHRAGFDVALSDDRIEKILDDTELFCMRIAKRVFSCYGWHFEPNWSRPSRRKRLQLARRTANTAPSATLQTSSKPTP